jgi:hypothetical protein
VLNLPAGEPHYRPFSARLDGVEIFSRKSKEVRHGHERAPTQIQKALPKGSQGGFGLGRNSMVHFAKKFHHTPGKIVFNQADLLATFALRDLEHRLHRENVTASQMDVPRFSTELQRTVGPLGNKLAALAFQKFTKFPIRQIGFGDVVTVVANYQATEATVVGVGARPSGR